MPVQKSLETYWMYHISLWLLLLIFSHRVFHISVSWWSFPRDWVTASLQNSSQYSVRSQQCCNFNSPLVTVPKTPITIGKLSPSWSIVFFNPLAKSKCLSFFSHSFSFILWSSGTAKSIILQIRFFFGYYNVWDIGPAVRVFANGPGDLGSIPGRVIPKTLKMVLDTTLLNTQHYKVRFKGKVEQSWEWSSALPYTLV